MRVSRVKIQNFRSLHDAEVNLDNCTTVIVGRNNSGKTTFAEIINRFLQPSTLNFGIADFSTECYPKFREAWEAYSKDDEEKARNAIPEISLTIEITYSKDLPEYGPLAVAIVDLDPDCTTAKVCFRYSLDKGRMSDFFQGLESGQELDDEGLLGIIGNRVQEMFSRSITAVDPEDPSNSREITQEAIRRLLTVHFLKAQRGLDDEKERPKDLISRILQSLFDSASNLSEENKQKEIAINLTNAVAKVEQKLDEEVCSMVEGIIPALEKFGYPGLADPGLQAKTTLDIERVLGSYTSLRYRGVAGVSLPESYSGLGSRNLILILLMLLSYYREYISHGHGPGIHLVFIEEPEAHLHPQMQEVFIEKLSSITDLFPKLDGIEQPWWPQFVVSTHSSHIANRANFSTIRYFRLGTDDNGVIQSYSEILDINDCEEIDKEFIHKYLTLTRSDLFFADKAILVEGTSERLVIPAAIEKMDKNFSSQYVTLMEVGGAYAYKFFPLLDFLGIPSLIITDIDTVAKRADGGKPKACVVSSATGTSNTTIKKWFEAIYAEEDNLFTLVKKAEKKDIIKENRYLAYQIPEFENGPCGRTFEDAFLLANPSIKGMTLTNNIDDDENLVREEAEKIKKSDFALKVATEDLKWEIPLYIQQGLEWLLNYSCTQNASNDYSGDAEVVIR